MRLNGYSAKIWKMRKWGNEEMGKWFNLGILGILGILFLLIQQKNLGVA
jgi:hypothetical protein